MAGETTGPACPARWPARQGTGSSSCAASATHLYLARLCPAHLSIGLSTQARVEEALGTNPCVLFRDHGGMRDVQGLGFVDDQGLNRLGERPADDTYAARGR